MTIHQNDSPIIGPNRPQKRILLLSLEFNFSPFSGNGVLARSLVSSLVRRTDCDVRIICARPHPSTSGLSKDVRVATSTSDDDNDSDMIWPVNLPQHCQWKRLDRSGPWEEYATACGDGRLGFATSVKEFQPTDVVAVDWHGMLAWESIRHAIISHDNFLTETTDNEKESSTWQPSNAAVCYFNFRVYSSSSWGHSGQPNEGTEQKSNDDQFYREKEQLSCRLASVIICLSEHDKCMIQRLIQNDNSQQQHEPIDERKIKNIHILYPPLRGDIWELASKNQEVGDFNHHLPPEAKHAIENSALSTSCKQRLFITCVVRLSPEKTPHHFVTLLKKLGGVDFLRCNSLVPIMCGARSVEDYAKKVVDDFQEMMCSSSSKGDNVWPCVVIDRHLGPKELAAVFSRTAVNVHPCLYDAYGMTLVEAAAFGAPSIVNNGGVIGAASLLGEGKGCMAVNLEQMLEEASGGNYEEKIVDALRTLTIPVDNSEKSESSENWVALRQIAKEARSKALHWDEMACCQGLIDVLNGLQMG